MKGLLTLLSLGIVLALSACSKTVTYYTLKPVQPLTSFDSSATGPVVEVRHVRFPGYLNNPQIMTTTATGEIKVNEYHRWVEDLGDNFQRTLLQDLAARLKSGDVYLSGYSNRTPQMVVEVEVMRFDQNDDGAAHLTARWTVWPHGDGAEARTGVVVREKQDGGRSYDDQVAALSALVDELAGEIALVVTTTTKR